MSTSKTFLVAKGLALREWLQKPLPVLILAATLAVGALILDGTLFNIWGLDRDRDRLQDRIGQLKTSVSAKQAHLEEVNKPEFIERQVREQLDFVRDGDLVFIFSNESSAPEESTRPNEKSVKASR